MEGFGMKLFCCILGGFCWALSCSGLNVISFGSPLVYENDVILSEISSKSAQILPRVLRIESMLSSGSICCFIICGY